MKTNLIAVPAAVVTLFVTACNTTTTVEIPASKTSKTKIVTKDQEGKKYKVKYKNKKPPSERKVKIVFRDGFTKAERDAVMKGVNNSLGAKKYKVKFEEYHGTGYPSGKFVSVQWYSHTLERKIPGHHGAQVNGFYMTAGFRLIGINDKLRGKLREIKYVCEHEADHAFGRSHLTDQQKKGLETMRMGGGILPSMDWGPWPSKPHI
jgi:hypothetical protein